VAVAALVAEGVRRSLDDDIAGVRNLTDVFGGPPKGLDEQPALEVRSKRPGAIQAINLPAVVTWARTHECLVVMRHFVGEFMEVDDPLMEVYGNPGTAATAERDLRGLVALGVERTIAQDPAFALRVMVDMANKALSAAVNDPRLQYRFSTTSGTACGRSARSTCRARRGIPRPGAASSSPSRVGRTSWLWA
jgi:hypothetical protein